MADPRIKGDVTTEGVSFTVGFVAGVKGQATVYLPATPPVRDPNGTQAEQSQGRIVFDFGQFEARFDIVPDGDPLPSYAPIIDAQNLSIGEDGTLNGTFTATDLDGNLDGNSWTQIGALAGFSLNADGTFTYVPPVSFQSLNVGETSTASVVVQVADDQGTLSPQAAFDITVTGASDAPVISAVGVITTNATSTVMFDAFATDVEGDIDPTTWRVGTPPAKGVVTVQEGGIGNIFDPNGEFGTLGINDFEDVTFTLLVDDLETSTASPVTVTARVTGVALAPVAVNGAISISEDETTPVPFNIAALCSDPDDDIASYELLSQPANFTVTFDTATGQGTLLPSPTAFQSLRAGQSATRPFQFRAKDATNNNSNSATFTITILGADDAPVSGARTVSVAAGGREDVHAGATDVDSAGLFNGVCFEFTDALVDLATGDTVGVGAFDFLNATNVKVGSNKSGRMMFYADTGDFATLPQGSTRTLRRNYRSRDAEGNWGPPAPVTITVTGVYQAVNTPPAMSPIVLATVAGQPVSEDLINHTTDPDGDFSGWAIEGQPLDDTGAQKGVFALSSDGTYPTGRLTYSPGNAFDGLLAGASVDVIGQVSAYDANTDQSNIVDALVQVTGTLVASPPNAENILLTVDYDAVSVTGQCVAVDPDGDLNPNGFAKSADPASGTLAVSASGVITFTLGGAFLGLTPGQSATVQGAYTAKDLGNRTDEALITINVVNNTVLGSPPVIRNRTRFCNWQATISGSVINHTSDVDADIDTTSFRLVTNVAEGALTTPPDGQEGGFWRFDPRPDFDDLTPGTERSVFFDVEVDDAAGNTSQPGRVTIIVQRPNVATNTPPVAANSSIEVDADATITNASVPAATDVDGNLNANGYALVSAGSPLTDGVITFRADGTYDYNPNGVFDGLMMGATAVRTFTYTASDAAGAVSSEATITVTINGVGMMAGMEPMYPKMAELAARWPFEVSGMSRVNALETAYPPDRTSVKSGPWNDPTVWSPAGVPQAGENVKIAWGHIVTYNEARTASFAGNKAYKMVFVRGTLKFAPFMNCRLRCDTLIGIGYGSHLDMQPANASVVHEISIPPNGNIDTTKDPALFTRGIVWHGTVQVMGYGADTVNEKDPYAYVDYWGVGGRKPVAGDTQLILAAAPVGWNVGDKLIVPATEQDDSHNVTPTWEDEEVTITAIAGNVVTFTPALVYDHDDLPNVATHALAFGDGVTVGGDKPQLVIANFSRNIKFTSEGGSGIPDWQRPHIMVMHRADATGVNWCDSEIVDFGRTRKIERAFTSQELGATPIVFDTNLKGRYGLHMHWVGIDPTDDRNYGMFEIERNAFYRSPGWHVAHHRGQGNVNDNVSWNAFGHYVAESGDETGEWTGNVAIRCRARRSNGATGFVKIIKDGDFVSNDDSAATGQGFFFRGRMVKAHKSARGWNRVYGSDGEAVAWVHRPGAGGYLSATDDTGPVHPNPENWDFGDAVAWNGVLFEPDKPRIGRSQHWQVTACRRAFHVVKNAPIMEHAVRIFFDDIIITGAMFGINWEYTQHYTARHCLISHSTRYPGVNGGRTDVGFVIFNNTPDIASIGVKIGGFGKAFEVTHVRTGATSAQPVAGAWGYVFDEILFGAQAGLAANVKDMADFLETRTGQDGVTGPEDVAYNMTFYSPQAGAIKTFGARPNALTTDTVAFLGLYQMLKQQNPTPQAEWNIQVNGGKFQLRGQTTDAYGVKPVPVYYGASDAFSPPNNGMDMIPRYAAHVGALLLRNGYWRDPSGRYFVDDVFVATARQRNAPTRVPFRLYLASTTPGVGGNPGSKFLGGGATFTFNGVK